MKTVLSGFYAGFEKDLSEAEKTVKTVTVPEQETDIVCEKCGARMVIRQGRNGRFAACPNYPTCRNTKSVDQEGKPVEKADTAEKTDVVCEKCGSEMLKRRGPFGEYLACSRYPACKNTKPILKPIGVNCPKCGARIVAKNGRKRSVFYSCERYPDCDFLSWDQPTGETCPQCGQMLYLKKGKQQQLVCHEKTCGYKRELNEGES